MVLIPFVLLFLFMLLGERRSNPRLFPPQGAERVSVFVADHGTHAGLVVPHAELAQSEFASVRSLASAFPEARWLELGWGDAYFYRAGVWENINWFEALRSFFLPTPSIVHAYAYRTRRAEDGFASRTTMLEVELSVEGFAALMRHLDQSLVTGQTGELIPSGAGLYGESSFFEAHGSYHFLSNSNQWVARGLNRAGVPLNQFVALFSAGLRWDLKLRANRS